MGNKSAHLLQPEEVNRMQDLTGFTPYQINRLHSRFVSLDRDDDGRMVRADLLRLPELYLHPLGERIVDRFLSQPNITFEQFLNVLAKFRPIEKFKENTVNNHEAKVKAIFDMFDGNRDGFMTINEFKTLLPYIVQTPLEQEDLMTKIIDGVTLAGLVAALPNVSTVATGAAHGAGARAGAGAGAGVDIGAIAGAGFMGGLGAASGLLGIRLSAASIGGDAASEIAALGAATGEGAGGEIPTFDAITGEGAGGETPTFGADTGDWPSGDIPSFGTITGEGAGGEIFTLEGAVGGGAGGEIATLGAVGFDEAAANVAAVAAVGGGTVDSECGSGEGEVACIDFEIFSKVMEVVDLDDDLTIYF